MFRKILLWLCLGNVLCFASPLWASISSMCTLQPCTVSGSVSSGLGGTLTITWRGVLLHEGFAVAELVQSNSGIFEVDTGVSTIQIGTSQTLVGRNVLYNLSGSQTAFSLVETLPVPATVSQQATNLGQTQVYYTRTFTAPTGATFTRTISFIIGPGLPTTPVTPPPPAPPPGPSNSTGLPADSALILDNIQLVFDDDSSLRVVKTDTAFNAQLRLYYSNSGLFSGVWELATPASTMGEPFFQPIENVNLALPPQREREISSPPLPTDENGLYILRFRVLRGAQVNPGNLLLHYFVNRNGELSGLRKLSMQIREPFAGTTLGIDTRFSWLEVPQAVAYRLEIYRAEDGDVQERKPISGSLVPATQTELLFSAISARHLVPNQYYQWRIIALDAEGRVIGESPLKDIRSR